MVLVTHIQIFSEWLGEQKVGIYHDEIYGRKKGSQPNWWDPKLGSSTSNTGRNMGGRGGRWDPKLGEASTSNSATS